MKHVVAKVTQAGNPNVIVTERGASFGYNRSSRTCAACRSWRRSPAARRRFDATHSVQQPGGQGASSGGQRGIVAVLARAAVAVAWRAFSSRPIPIPTGPPPTAPTWWR